MPPTNCFIFLHATVRLRLSGILTYEHGQNVPSSSVSLPVPLALYGYHLG